MHLERRPNLTTQLLPIEKLVQQKRLYPRKIAHSYLSGQPPTAQEQAHSAPTTSNTLLLTDEEREERLALQGLMIDWMIHGANNMSGERPPYGLVYSENGFDGDFSDENMKVVQDANLLGDPFTTFAFAIRHTLADALKQKLNEISAIPEGRETAIYERYLGLAHRSGTLQDDPDSIRNIVSSSNTALRIMGDILAHASDIDSASLGRKVNFEESLNAARNSTPLIIKLSSIEENVFNVIYAFMSEGGIWRSLTIVELAGKMYYQIKENVLQNAINQLSKPDIREGLEKNKRAGCPAGMRFDGRKSAIETLWNWYIDYAETVQHKKS